MESSLILLFGEEKGSRLSKCVHILDKYPTYLVQSVLFELLNSEINAFVNNLIKKYITFIIDIKGYINVFYTDQHVKISLRPTYKENDIVYEEMFTREMNNIKYTDFVSLDNVLSVYTTLVNYAEQLYTIFVIFENFSRSQKTSRTESLQDISNLSQFAKVTYNIDIKKFDVYKTFKYVSALRTSVQLLEPTIVSYYVKQQPTDLVSFEVVESLEKTSIIGGGVMPYIFERINEWDNADIVWRFTSKGIGEDVFRRLSDMRFGLINHFTGSMRLAKKDSLMKHLSYHKISDIAPITFMWNGTHNWKLINTLQSFGRDKLWIVKPVDQWGGSNIKLMNTDEIKSLKSKHIIQEYISDPWLWENHKFDIRIHVLVTSLLNGGISVYLHLGGLVRICTKVYNPESKDPMVFLTNNAIHKKVAKTPEDILQDLFNIKGLDHDKALESIKESVRKLFWNSSSVLNPKKYIASFQLFGLDFLLDKNQRPYLLEVNSTPFVEYIQGGGKWSKKIKKGMLREMWKIVISSRLGVEIKTSNKRYKFSKVF